MDHKAHVLKHLDNAMHELLRVYDHLEELNLYTQAVYIHSQYAHANYMHSIISGGQSLTLETFTSLQLVEYCDDCNRESLRETLKNHLFVLEIDMASNEINILNAHNYDRIITTLRDKGLAQIVRTYLAERENPKQTEDLTPC